MLLSSSGKQRDMGGFRSLGDGKNTARGTRTFSQNTRQKQVDRLEIKSMLLWEETRTDFVQRPAALIN